MGLRVAAFLGKRLLLRLVDRRFPPDLAAPQQLKGAPDCLRIPALGEVRSLGDLTRLTREIPRRVGGERDVEPIELVAVGHGDQRPAHGRVRGAALDALLARLASPRQRLQELDLHGRPPADLDEARGLGPRGGDVVKTLERILVAGALLDRHEHPRERNRWGLPRRSGGRRCGNSGTRVRSRSGISAQRRPKGSRRRRSRPG